MRDMASTRLSVKQLDAASGMRDRWNYVVVVGVVVVVISVVVILVVLFLVVVVVDDDAVSGMMDKWICDNVLLVEKFSHLFI